MQTDPKPVPEYEKPRISDYGDLKVLTAGELAGPRLDATFPTNTPQADLRFSTGPTG
jgi:hypothetical protein